MTNTKTEITIDGQTYDLHAWADGPLPDLSGSNWRDLATDEWSGGGESIYRYTIADGIYLYVYDGPYGPCASIDTADIDSYVADLDHDCDLDEWLAAWDLEPAFMPAADDYVGQCRIWCQPHYYQGTTNAPRPCYLREEHRPDDIRIFADRAAAQAYIDEYYGAPSAYDGVRACNVLGHGQYAADTLTICEA